jgi:RNA ligase
MNFFKYINRTPAVFLNEYINTGLVDIATHDTFPLDLYTYGRKTVHENVWDTVTSKCRGIIVNRETGEVVARPFEKFHNYGSMHAANIYAPATEAMLMCTQYTWEDKNYIASKGSFHNYGSMHASKGSFHNYGSMHAANIYAPATEAMLSIEPIVWEKMDGFMCTQYTWEDKNYIASKGSFHSPHAKWATKEFNRVVTKMGYSEEDGSLRHGWTLMFEGLNRDLRIVVDYGQRQELVLLAVIHNETGEELPPEELRKFAKSIGFSTPLQNNLTLAEANRMTLQTGVQDKLDEGFVLTWYKDKQPPFRLKLKYVEYLRLHRLVTGMSPKGIWEILSQGLNVDEYVNNSTPWFKEFFLKWQRVLVGASIQIELDANKLYQAAQAAAEINFPNGFKTLSELHEGRKFFASQVSASELSSLAFAILDGKDLKPIIWKRVKVLTRNCRALRDASQ